jgi:hypothetical protein
MRSLDYVRSALNAAVVALALSALPASGAAAGSVPWVVVESHGDVTQQTADGALPLAPGATLAEGAPIRTGADGALVIAHGNDRATVSANSAFILPKGVDPATGPSILETLGTLLFKVEHTPGRRFEVDTPYLAAVVKGTVFTVTVGAEQMVHVAEGAVEVSALASHNSVLVKPGQTATLSSPSGTPSVIDGASPAEPGSNAPRTDERSDATRAPVSTVPRNAATSGAVRLTQTLGDLPLDVAALTNGLVKAAKDAAPAALAVAPDDAATAGNASVSVGTGNLSISTGGSTLSVSAGSPTDVSSAAAAAATPSVSAPPVGGGSPTVVSVNATTPVAGVAAPVNTPIAIVTGLVPALVDPVVSAVHGASGTAKLPGANNPAARKLLP